MESYWNWETFLRKCFCEILYSALNETTTYGGSWHQLVVHVRRCGLRGAWFIARNFSWLARYFVRVAALPCTRDARLIDFRQEHIYIYIYICFQQVFPRWSQMAPRGPPEIFGLIQMSRRMSPDVPQDAPRCPQNTPSGPKTYRPKPRRRPRVPSSAPIARSRAPWNQRPFQSLFQTRGSGRWLAAGVLDIINYLRLASAD